MRVSGIVITFIIGLLIFIIGAATKKKWLMMISIIPLVIVIIQIGVVISIAIS